MAHTPLSILVPPRCHACGRPGDRLCRECRAALPWITDPVCRRCGLPGDCGGNCPAAGWAFDAAWAPLAYDGPVPRLVRALKQRGALPIADLMAAMMIARAPANLIDACAIVVPVPADPWRRRLRGLDHAGVLAEAVADRARLRAARVLARSAAHRQVGQGRRGRIAAPARVRMREDLCPGPVILIDDVHTTGATLSAAASALRDAGCGPVVAMTFGRSI